MAPPVTRQPDVPTVDDTDTDGFARPDEAAETDEPGPDTGAIDTAPPEDTGDTGSPSGGGPTVPATDVCFPGASNQGGTCFPTIPIGAWGGDWDWPASADPRYREPSRVVDLDAITLSTKVAPNFTAGEFLVRSKGRYGILQPHMVERLQGIRTAIGAALQVTSGFRGPGYNAGVGGATFSRHMYGDGADIFSSALSIEALGARCQSAGATYVQLYTGHVHCDWRSDPLEPAFYGTPFAPPAHPADLPVVSATLVPGVGTAPWTAPATGFDEGEPLRVWTAWDASGRSLGRVVATAYTPPPAATDIQVVVGGLVTLRAPR